jgi:hypothetical protein
VKNTLQSSGVLRHNGSMKIFLSSVRAGLEQERDALPGLIKALGHEPVRFEEFTAKSVPSRQACIEGVESSDAYLLLLGPRYGHIFPETGQSATHDEWITAQRLGIPRYVFKKTGIEFEREQAVFEQQLGDYGSGRFYKTFGSVTDLQTIVASAIREIESAPSPLEFHPLTANVSIHWLEPANGSRGYMASDRPRLEVHVVPVDGRPLSARILEEVMNGMPAVVRASGLVSSIAALETNQGTQEVSLSVPHPTNVRRGDVYAGSIESVRVRGDGQIAVAFHLPGDQLGLILDPQDVTVKVASALRLAGQIDRTAAANVVLGIGLTSGSTVTLGEVSQRSRNSSHMSLNDGPTQVEPDETITRAAFDLGANEVAALATRSLVRAFSRDPWGR